MTDTTTKKTRGPSSESRIEMAAETLRSRGYKVDVTERAWRVKIDGFDAEDFASAGTAADHLESAVKLLRPKGETK